jgi:pimeloyl-ACP methyl ester carboxylesterase
MMAALSKLLDRFAITLAAARMPQPDGRDPRLHEALQLLNTPDFIPAQVEPAKMRFDGQTDFQFDTPRPGPFAENNIVRGRFYRCSERWQERPTVLLLHGWNDASNHYVRFPFLAAQFNRSGINAATLTAPFHFQRRPRRLGAWSNFLCPDILRTVESIQQAIAEIRSFSEWLRQQGCPAVGLLGVSLGGLLAGLTVCHDARFSCAVLLVPVACLDRLLAEAKFCRGIRLAWEGRPVAAGKLNLKDNRPVLPRQNILLIEALHDLFVPVETTEELWRAWDQPDIWRLRHGHISVLTAPGLYGRMVGWMAPRLGVRDAK